MIGKILTVGGYTLVSRLSGFLRDIMLAAMIGAGPVADAFFVAFRLPNHFRAIFAEGAFNSAFIPAYARVRTEQGTGAAKQFGDRIFTLLLASQIVLLALAYWFPSAGYAAAWGVLISGVLQALLVGGDTFFSGAMTSFRALRWDKDVRRFFKALLPATLGSAGTQLALFADTIIASFLSAGAISALYYADRINQLPIGVIGIAVGTVLVPEMTHRLASGDQAGAQATQNRAI